MLRIGDAAAQIIPRPLAPCFCTREPKRATFSRSSSSLSTWRSRSGSELVSTFEFLRCFLPYASSLPVPAILPWEHWRTLCLVLEEWRDFVSSLSRIRRPSRSASGVLQRIHPRVLRPSAHGVLPHRQSPLSRTDPVCASSPCDSSHSQEGTTRPHTYSFPAFLRRLPRYPRHRVHAVPFIAFVCHKLASQRVQDSKDGSKLARRTWIPRWGL
ncbi:hypothetical protein B0H11DRAFT_1311655 [Mycena galericulata]|nr:hypothetical protein B0H11DRAFT_1311655 [Mycena galericulata]